MFVGHIAVALIAKRARPSSSLGWYVAAATMLDLLWPIFLLVGIEHVSFVAGASPFGGPLVFDSYPWSHSLLMSIVWGVVLAGIARWRGIEPTTAALIGALVVSHWALDLVVHAPDLPLWPGASPLVGFDLWRSISGTLIVEGALWIAGIAIYLKPRRATGWIGRIAFWSLVVLLTVIWASGPWAPVPASQRALAWFAMIAWIAVPWAAWADRGYVVARTD